MPKNSGLFFKKCLLLLTFVGFSSCSGDKKNVSGDQNVNTNPEEFCRYIENFPIFKVETEKITDAQKNTLAKYLKSRKENFEPFFSSTNNQSPLKGSVPSQNTDSEQQYKETFFKYLKIYEENFSAIVNRQYISTKFENIDKNEADFDKMMIDLGKYKSFLKKKYSTNLDALKDPDVFCKNVNISGYIEKNRISLLLAYIIVNYKVFGNSNVILNMVDMHPVFNGILDRDDLLAFIFLVVNPER